jgi:hypothetical protein
MQIAFLDASDVKTEDVLFAAAACHKQMVEHLAPAYGREPWPVVHYRSVTDLPPDSVYVLWFVDRIAPGILGDHNMLKSGRTLWKGNPDWVRTASHEVCEMFGNIGCNLWLPHPARPGLKLAYELNDPCQAGGYDVGVTVMGVTRVLTVSDFVLPAYWVPGAPGPYNWNGDMPEPGGILPGGYQIVRDERGVRSFLPHQDTPVMAMADSMRSDGRAFQVMSSAA